MLVTYTKHINIFKKNRVEFLLMNWDYEDGSDYLAKIFCDEFSMQSEAKVEGIYFSTIRLHSKEGNYELMWHEDLGNLVYSIEQSETANDILEKRLQCALRLLNEKLYNSQ